MSLFQCPKCGCVENTALTSIGMTIFPDKWNWKDTEEFKGKLLCSACAPNRYVSNGPTGLGHWHNRFERTFLPLGLFQTNSVGNLEHKESKDTDYHKYAIPKPSNV